MDSLGLPLLSTRTAMPGTIRFRFVFKSFHKVDDEYARQRFGNPARTIRSNE